MSFKPEFTNYHARPCKVAFWPGGFTEASTAGQRLDDPNGRLSALRDKKDAAEGFLTPITPIEHQESVTHQILCNYSELSHCALEIELAARFQTNITPQVRFMARLIKEFLYYYKGKANYGWTDEVTAFKAGMEVDPEEDAYGDHDPDHVTAYSKPAAHLAEMILGVNANALIVREASPHSWFNSLDRMGKSAGIVPELMNKHFVEILQILRVSKDYVNRALDQFGPIIAAYLKSNKFMGSDWTTLSLSRFFGADPIGFVNAVIELMNEHPYAQYFKFTNDSMDNVKNTAIQPIIDDEDLEEDVIEIVLNDTMYNKYKETGIYPVPLVILFGSIMHFMFNDMRLMNYVYFGGPDPDTEYFNASRYVFNPRAAHLNNGPPVSFAAKFNKIRQDFDGLDEKECIDTYKRWDIKPIERFNPQHQKFKCRDGTIFYGFRATFEALSEFDDGVDFKTWNKMELLQREALRYFKNTAIDEKLIDGFVTEFEPDLEDDDDTMDIE